MLSKRCVELKPAKCHGAFMLNWADTAKHGKHLQVICWHTLESRADFNREGSHIPDVMQHNLQQIDMPIHDFQAAAKTVMCKYLL